MHQAADSASGAHDFDFLVGDWIVENKKLLKPLEKSAEWETFQASLRMQKFPAGIGNFEEFSSKSWRPGFVGMAIRIFNGETGLWSIYWLNNKNGGIDANSGSLTPPVVGKFENGIGVFLGADQFNGKPIMVRYCWSEMQADSARWEQAFSPDGGASWESNWSMALRRAHKQSC